MKSPDFTRPYESAAHRCHRRHRRARGLRLV